jgi:hypothetical protein
MPSKEQRIDRSLRTANTGTATAPMGLDGVNIPVIKRTIA